MNKLQTTTLVDETAGLVFLEGPRWHGGKLWVSDMWGYNVYTIDAKSGAREHVVKVAERPSGLAFAKDGTPVIVSMENRQLVKLVGGQLMWLNTQFSVGGATSPGLGSGDGGEI